MLGATDPAVVQRHDIYDRTAGRTWAAGPVVLVGDPAHPMRPHLGQGGCQALEDAAILGRFVGDGADLPGAFNRFAAFRRRRVVRLIRNGPHPAAGGDRLPRSLPDCPRRGRRAGVTGPTGAPSSVSSPAARHRAERQCIGRAAAMALTGWVTAVHICLKSTTWKMLPGSA